MLQISPNCSKDPLNKLPVPLPGLLSQHNIKCINISTSLCFPVNYFLLIEVQMPDEFSLPDDLGLPLLQKITHMMIGSMAVI